MAAATVRERPREYWAATADLKALAGSLEEKICRFYDRIGRGPLDDWRRATRLYFGRDPNGTNRTSHRVTSGGEEGETPEVLQNEFRSVLRHLVTLTTGTRPAIIAKSRTPDYRARAARQIAEAIIEQAISEGSLEDRMVDACEIALYLGEGYVYQWWDPDAGDQLDVEELTAPGQEEKIAEYQEAAARAELDRQPPPEPPEIETFNRVVFTGDVRELALLPDDVVRDVTSEHWPEDARWIIVRRRVNRYELAAIYPEHRDLIIDAEDDPKWSYTLRDEDPEFTRDGDGVAVFEFYHLSTHALPGGRASVWLGGEVIADGPLKYRGLPVHAMIPAQKPDEPFGYAKAFDLMGPQQALDAASSTALANHDALGQQKVWARTGSGLEVRDLGGGVKVLESAEPPVALKLMESDEASEQQAEYWRGVIERLSGVNSVSRGEPQASLKSGVALAFVDSKSLQANSDLQRTFARAWEDVASARIEIMRRFCTEPRLIEVSGKSKATSVREFVGDDLSAIARVTVELGNPLLRTTSGRMEIGQQLFQAQAITGPQYIEMIATGRIDPVTDRPERHATLIAQENEALLDGRPVIVLKSDDHRRHVEEHLAVLDDPETRFDDALVSRVTAHVDEHVRLAQQLMMLEPALMELSGQAPLQSIAAAPPMPPGGPMPPPPGPSGPPEPQGGPQQAPPVIPGVTGTPAGDEVAAGLPAMPADPALAQRAVMERSGGMAM